MKKALDHILTVALCLMALLGIPFVSTDYGRAVLRGQNPDAVSGATMVLDQPSGNYVALINEKIRTDEETLAYWKDFFAGEEVDYCFEDITCAVARGDAAGLDMAQSMQSMLPENQMTVRIEDPTLLLSKAEYGHFDVIILSEEMAESYSASSLYDNEGTIMIAMKGAAS